MRRARRRGWWQRAALRGEATAARGRVRRARAHARCARGVRREHGGAPPHDPAPYAHDLYANLRTLDAVGAAEILIEAVPEDDAWLAIADRLTRAVHAEDDDRD